MTTIKKKRIQTKPANSNNNVGLEPLHTVGRNAKCCTWKTVWGFLKPLKMGLPCDSAIPLLAMHQKNSKQDLTEIVCIPMFIVALFIIAKMWEATQVSISRWMDKQNVAYIYNEVLFNLQQENPVTCYNMNEPQGHYAKWASHQKTSIIWLHLYNVPRVVRVRETE